MSGIRDFNPCENCGCHEECVDECTDEILFTTPINYIWNPYIQNCIGYVYKEALIYYYNAKLKIFEK